MSEILVNKLTGTSTAGSILVTGEGNSTTTNLQQGLCKVWAISNAGAAASDSFNLASTTDNGTGDYTFAISSDMGSANYSHPIGASLADGGAGLGVSIASKAAGSLRIGTIRDDSTKTDCTNISLSILGDLA
jgi:hypothetical protein